MKPQPHSFFSRVLFILYVLIVLAMLAGRSHFITGTGLYVTRWLWIVLGLLFFVRIHKTGYTLRLKMITILLVSLLAELGFTRFMRASLPDTAYTHQVSILTYNVFFKNKRPDETLKIITHQQANLIALQEVTPEWEQKLNTGLAKTHPYKRMLAMKGTHGMAVYSRHNIISDTVLNDDAGRPVAMFIEININGKGLLLINTHLASPAAAVEHPDNFIPLYARSYKLRNIQVNEIHRIIKNKFAHLPVRILTGDLNTLPYEPVYQQELLGNWVNLFDEAGRGSPLNFPNSSRTAPRFTLDYILLQGDVQPGDAMVITGGNSDHFAVWGQIKI